MLKFRVGQRVLVTEVDAGIERESAVVERADASDYWCVFDRGRKTERKSWDGASLEETRLDPAWFDEEQLQEA